MERTAMTVAAVCLLAAAARAAGPAGPVKPPDAAFFESRVRPVLAEHCFGCHGPQKQKSGLRLDSRAAALKGGDGGPVIVPGDPDHSPLVQAVRYAGDTKMPPKGRLSAPAVEAITAWVRMGAPWPEARPAADAHAAARRHWAFQPVRDPAVPAPPGVYTPGSPLPEGWPRTPVDAFILSWLRAQGLAPSPPADRRTLIRRATFDLTGLPPTPEEIAAFEADPAPDAYERLVDRLLASPAYGERWGRYWLDVARYADTKGYVFFQEPEFPWAYTYRDYVIRAFNQDLPYDRFVVEQLAADRLPLGADRRPLAALGFLTLGARFMNNAQDILDDRIDVTTRGLLGLTVTCARCHDHKFDPIPQADYYSLYGVFASCAEPTVPPLFEPPPHSAAYEAFARELEKRERKLTEFVRAKHEELVNAARTRVAEYMLAAHAARRQPNAEEFMLLADGNDLNPRMLSRWRRYLEGTRRAGDSVFALWHALEDLPAKQFADRAPACVHRLAAGSGSPHPVNPIVLRSFVERPPRTLAEAAHRYGELLNGIERRWRQSPGGPLPDPAEEQLRLVFHGPNSPPNVVMNPLGDLDLLPDRPSQAKLQELRKAVETWRSTGPGAPPRAMVLEDLPAPFQPYVFLRGNPNNRGATVPRQFLAVVAGPRRRPFHEGSGRLELARAITDPANPLFARVMVNRVWMHHFGVGLVRTPSDFGLRSDPPSHPELLDHLASAFVRDGWSVKALHRRIMLSAVYRQRSDDRPDGRRVDPENTLLWRMNRRRLDFEATRDALLAVSGRLHRRMGGPPARDTAAPTATRRTVYSFLDRLNVPGLFRTFDFPTPDATSPQRVDTTVAPQALFLMNSPFALSAARGLVQRPDVAAGVDPARKIDRLHRLLYGRPPTAEESALARAFLTRPAEWEPYAQALLLANEFVFVD